MIEKNTGRVLRNNNGTVTTVLDLAVNFASERGLLGIAVHPQFPENPGVDLFWTCRSATSGTQSPASTRCEDSAMFGQDTNDLLSVPLLGNRVDRFVWNGSALTYDRNLIMLRSYQNDGAATPAGQGDQAQPARGNHNGGVLAFGPDSKLYVYFGDQGRRGQMQNLTTLVADDQFGGPQPDAAHLSGVVLRMNPDGTAPADNPFFTAGSAQGGEAGQSIQFVYAYGLRNGFGMAFEPKTGFRGSPNMGMTRSTNSTGCSLA